MPLEIRELVIKSNVVQRAEDEMESLEGEERMTKIIERIKQLEERLSAMNSRSSYSKEDAARDIPSIVQKLLEEQMMNY